MPPGGTKSTIEQLAELVRKTTTSLQKDHETLFAEVRTLRADIGRSLKETHTSITHLAHSALAEGMRAQALQRVLLRRFGEEFGEEVRAELERVKEEQIQAQESMQRAAAERRQAEEAAKASAAEEEAVRRQALIDSVTVTASQREAEIVDDLRRQQAEARRLGIPLRDYLVQQNLNLPGGTVLR